VQPDPLRDLDLDPVLGFHPAVLLLLTLPKSSNEWTIPLISLASDQDRSDEKGREYLLS
jgi:hypothetical protein